MIVRLYQSEIGQYQYTLYIHVDSQKLQQSIRLICRKVPACVDIFSKFYGKKGDVYLYDSEESCEKWIYNLQVPLISNLSEVENETSFHAFHHILTSFF